MAGATTLLSQACRLLVRFLWSVKPGLWPEVLAGSWLWLLSAALAVCPASFMMSTWRLGGSIWSVTCLPVAQLVSCAMKADK